MSDRPVEMASTAGVTKTFPATRDGMADAMAFLDAHCLNPRISIVFDEIASNIVRCSGATQFEICFVPGPPIALRISDDGKPFDPTQVPEPDVSAPAEDRPVGGLGLLMVRKMTKSVAYSRADGRNVLDIAM